MARTWRDSIRKCVHRYHEDGGQECPPHRGPRMKYAIVVVLLLVANTQAAPRFELVDGDRVVFIGNTFVERDIKHNYLETLLTAQWPERNVTFRNMGWSGDTVFVPARAGSGPN